MLLLSILDINSARMERIRSSSNCARAKSVADVNRSSLACSPASTWAMASILAKVTGSGRNGADRPCRYALRLDFNLPAGVLGPQLSRALARLAAICFSVAIVAPPGSRRSACGPGDFRWLRSDVQFLCEEPGRRSRGCRPCGPTSRAHSRAFAWRGPLVQGYSVFLQQTDCYVFCLGVTGIIIASDSRGNILICCCVVKEWPQQTR